MSPDQLTKAAVALTPPTGGVASQGGASEVGSDSDSDGNAAKSSARPASNGRGGMTSSSDEDGEGESEGGGELTRAEALAMLRRSKGKEDELPKPMGDKAKSNEKSPRGE